MPLTVGDQVGRIIGARPGTTCMHQNVTVAVAVVLSCFRLESQIGKTERNRIVYLEGEFPSVRYVLQAQPGAEIEVVPDLDALLEAIDERTLLVPLSHVLFKTAELQDVEAVQRRAEEVGAHVLLDAYQSAGAVPVDVEKSGVAFATGGSVKWLCGGPGAGWLYVRPDLIDELEPAFVGWQGHAQAVRVRAGARVRRRNRALPDRHPERPRALRGHRRLRRDRGGRRGNDPPAVARTDRPADPARRRGRASRSRPSATRRAAARA